MEDWAQRGLQRWPKVPALFGWLSLDRRGRWLIKDELISRPQIIDTINRNYAADEHGRWFFQNGPQRGYMQLQVAPLVLSIAADGDALMTHNGLPVQQLTRVFLDEEGSLLLQTEHGAGGLRDDELGWALSRLRVHKAAVNEAQLSAALALRSSTLTELTLHTLKQVLPVTRLDREQAPAWLGFVRQPAPLNGERCQY